MGTTARREPKEKKTALAGVRTARRDPRLEKLAKDYRQALDQQDATAEILRALSRSAGEVQPVFDVIVRQAHRLCGAVFSIVYRYDGAMLSVVADNYGKNSKGSRVLRSMYPAPPRADHIIGRAILE